MQDEPPRPEANLLDAGDRLDAVMGLPPAASLAGRLSLRVMV